MIDHGVPFSDVQRAAFFQLDPLVSIEFFNTFKRKMYLEPEKLLMLAVLEDAVMCIQKYAKCPAGKNRRIFDETKEWLFADEEEWLFSFGSICDSLGLNPSYFRRELLRVGEKVGTRKRPAVASLSAASIRKKMEKRLAHRLAAMG